MVEVLLLFPRWMRKDAAGDQDPGLQGPSQAETDTPEQVLDGVHSLEAQGGLKEWELWATKALRPKGASLWKIERVRIEFFQQNAAAYFVEGDRGEIREATKDLMVEGNVVIRSGRGHEFRTETVTYKSEKKSLQAPKDVRMRGPQETSKSDSFQLQGQSMTTSLVTNEIQVVGKVRATKQLKGSREMRIQSQRALFSGQQNGAKFLGQVVIDVDTTRITGPEAEFRYRPESDDIESLSVRGGVRMSDADRWAVSDSVLFDLATEKYLFEGSPRLVQGGDEIIGDRIIVSQAGREVEILNAKAKVDRARVEKTRETVK